MKKIFSLAVLLILSASSVFADIRPGNSVTKPKPSPSPKKEASAENEIPGRLHIRVRSDVKEPVLVIKRDTLSRLRAAIDEADDAQRQTLAGGASFNFSRTQTIISGLFFSLAFVFGGVWMFRAKGKSSKLAMSLIGLAILSAGAGAILANTPPPYAVSLTSRIFSQSTYAYGWAEGDIKIKISDEEMRGYDFQLHIPDAEKNAKNE